MEGFVEANGIHLHYMAHGDSGPTLILLPGLTANAYSFGGLVATGLADELRVVAIDMRGRGRSDAPDGPYDVATHASDVLAVMDALGLAKASVGGHSFGGLVSYYLAANHPDRVERCVAMDAPAEVHIGIMDQIRPSLDRLGVVFPSWDQYLAAIKAAPYFFDWEWDPALEDYYRNDVQVNPDGTVQAISRPEHIEAAALATLDIDWPEVVGRITQPTLLLRATLPLGSPEVGPIVSRQVAERALERIPNATLVEIPGNHITFLFGRDAAAVVREVVGFLA